ncbi:MAG: radical SAM protein [Deltaproteobacteria bacterium]|jgi:DNA repair photolyase
MDFSEITIKTALVKSRIPGVDYVINPYLGCGHGCRYCYAVFMRRYARHHAGAPWGSFVEVKVNLARVLTAELARKKHPGQVFLSSVCDPYQPVELKYRLTRNCLEILGDFGWSVNILTRSPLVIRDLDLFAALPGVSLGLSIPTDDDQVRRVLEPHAPSIQARIATLKKLHDAGLSPWVFIAPILPLDPARLHGLIGPYASRVMMDPLNYRIQVRAIFQRHRWDYALTDTYATRTRAALKDLFQDRLRPAGPDDSSPNQTGPLPC